MARATSFCVIIVALLFFFSWSAFAEEHKVFLTTNPKLKLHVNQFDCSEKIYIYAELRGLKKGAHKTEVNWINPRNRLQQVSTHEFTTKGGGYNAWFWLKLKPSFGGEFFGNIDSSFGMSEFIGRWSVRLYIDGDLIAEPAFYVAC